MTTQWVISGNKNTTIQIFSFSLVHTHNIVFNFCLLFVIKKQGWMGVVVPTHGHTLLPFESSSSEVEVVRVERGKHLQKLVCAHLAAACVCKSCLCQNLVNQFLGDWNLLFCRLYMFEEKQMKKDATKTVKNNSNQ